MALNPLQFHCIILAIEFPIGEIQSRFLYIILGVLVTWFVSLFFSCAFVSLHQRQWTIPLGRRGRGGGLWG